MARLPICCAVLAIVACTVPASSGVRCSWDETYKGVVASARAFPSKAASDEARRSLADLARLIRMRPERAALRKEALSVGVPVDQIRLEAMIPNPEAFRAVWLIRSDRSLVAVTYGLKGVQRRPVSEREWNQIVKLVNPGNLNSWLNQTVADGPAYFVSFDIDGVCGQYALYAPIFSEVMPERYKAFDRKIRREKDIVQHLLRTARYGR
jgi:hypothetical protein